MDRITHQSPRPRGYGSTSSLRNDSLKHTRKHERKRGGIEPRGKAHRLWRTVRPGGADRPHWPRGPSGLKPRTVRANPADCPALRRGPSVKAHRTTRSDPRKTDRPPRLGGLSARVTDRPLLKLGPSANHLQQKTKSQTGSKARTRKNTTNTRRTLAARTVRQHPADCPPGADRAKNARPRKSTPPNHHRISQTVEAMETRVWGLEKRHTRML
jgi:hypothetical protein